MAHGYGYFSSNSFTIKQISGSTGTELSNSYSNLGNTHGVDDIQGLLDGVIMDHDQKVESVYKLYIDI